MINNFLFTKDSTLISKNLSKNLLTRFDEIYEKNIYNHKNYSHIYELKNDDILKEPLFLSLLNRIKKKFELITSVTDLDFDKLWFVSSTSNDSKKTTLPYIPHIDKRRYLKAMVYLHDVSLEHGPIHLGQVKNNIDIEQKRKKLPHDYKEKGLNNINDKDLDGSLMPMTGKAGDVIFFDTNTPHKAGIIKNNYNRKVLRFDFERPHFNLKPSMLNNIMTKIIKRLKKDI